MWRNVIIIHQRPRMPESNMLDLGVWMHLQHHLVKLTHIRKRCTLKALWESMANAWGTISQQALTNVYKCWKKVIELMIEAGGSSRLVEKRRGKLFTAPSEEAEMWDDDKGAEEFEFVDEYDEAAGDEVIDWPGGRGSAT